MGIPNVSLPIYKPMQRGLLLQKMKDKWRIVGNKKLELEIHLIPVNWLVKMYRLKQLKIFFV